MTRRQEAVRRVFEKHSGAFAYGTHDCCQLALDVVREVRGDPDAIVAPRYSSEDEAAEVIQIHGGIAAMVTTLLGREPTQDAPRDGDLALVHLVGIGGAMAVWCSGRPVALTSHGFIPMCPSHAKLTWRVD